MLHTKFQGHQPSGSGEEDFLMFLPYTGMAAISFPHPKEAPYEIWLQSVKQFLSKGSSKMLNLSDHGPRSMNDPDL